MSNGIAIVLSGPGGVGKSTILKEMLHEDGIVMSVSCTTREPRPGEEDGVHYYFLSRDEFMRRADAGEMAEWAEVAGNLYGTPKIFLDEKSAAGLDVIMDIDVQGARQLKQACPGAVMIFVVASSRQTLEERLRGRGTDTEARLNARMELAEREMREIVNYEYVVVNDTLEDAVARVSAIRCAEHVKTERVKEEFTW